MDEIGVAFSVVTITAIGVSCLNGVLIEKQGKKIMKKANELTNMLEFENEVTIPYNAGREDVDFASYLVRKYHQTITEINSGIEIYQRRLQNKEIGLPDGFMDTATKFRISAKEFYFRLGRQTVF